MKFSSVIAAPALAGALALGAMTTASAASTGEQVQMCASAVKAKGLNGNYQARLIKIKGGALKTVTIRLIELGGGEAKKARCKIRSGQVVEANMIG